MTRPRVDDLPAMEGPGVGQKKIPSVEKSARLYVEARDARQAMLKTELERKATLIDEMHKHACTNYVFDDFEVVLKPGKENVKVRGINEEDDTDGDSEEDNA